MGKYLIILLAMVMISWYCGVEGKKKRTTSLYEKLDQLIDHFADECTEKQHKKWYEDDQAIEDHENFSDPDYKLSSRNIGCLMDCVGRSMRLFKNGHVDYFYVIVWLKEIGVGPKAAYAYLDVLVICRNMSTSKDPCMRALEIVNCLRVAGFSSYQRSLRHKILRNPHEGIVVNF